MVCVPSLLSRFFGLTTPNLALNSNPGSDEWDSWICEGTDFVRFHVLPAIDFTVAHMYPDLWVDRPCNGSDYCKKLFASRWVDTHIEQSIALGKPFVLEEFGSVTTKPKDPRDKGTILTSRPNLPLPASDLPGRMALSCWNFALTLTPFSFPLHSTFRCDLISFDFIFFAGWCASGSYEKSMRHREDIFETVFSEMEEAAAGSDISVGSLFWSFSSLKYPDYDGFSVYYGGEGEAPTSAGGDGDGGSFDWETAAYGGTGSGQEDQAQSSPAPAPQEEEEDAMDHIWLSQVTTPAMQSSFRNAKKHKQCARYLRKSVREGKISSSYRERPEEESVEGTTTTLVAFRQVETSHDDTINIISNAARMFRKLSKQDDLYNKD